MSLLHPRQCLLELWYAALKAAQPERVLPAYLPPPPAGRTVVIGAGKAAAAMAATLDAHWPANAPLTGVVVTRYGQARAAGRIRVLEAAHPLPDHNSVYAAQLMLQQVHGLSGDDLVIALISGGGSALLALPAPGLSLDDKQQITQALLDAGASIDEINCVRKHLSAIKGGRLAHAAYPAPVLTLAISDVPGDHPGIIASGPTVPDSSSCNEALAILRRYHIHPAQRVETHLHSAAAETPKQLRHTQFQLIANPQSMLEAAAARARQFGLQPLILGDALEGEARELGRALAGIARQVVVHQQPITRPCVLLSGGETTVTLRGHGRGGRNSEFLLGLALGLRQLSGVYALAAATDGIDGNVECAGAYLAPDTLYRARQLGIDIHQCLANNDSYWVFSKLGDALHSGPTDTNVNDFRALLIV